VCFVRGPWPRPWTPQAPPTSGGSTANVLWWRCCSASTQTRKLRRGSVTALARRIPLARLRRGNVTACDTGAAKIARQLRAMPPAATAGAPPVPGLDGGGGGSGPQWRLLPVVATSTMTTAAVAAPSVAEEMAGAATVWPADWDTKTKKQKSHWKRCHLK